MNKTDYGAFIIGIALGSGVALFTFDGFIKLDFKYQIIFGIIPVIILTIIGSFIHVYYNYMEKQTQ